MVLEGNTILMTTALQRLRRAVMDGLVNKEYGTLTVQARLLAQRCQELTPPRNAGQGKAAVSRDITRIFRPLSPKTFPNDKSLQRIVRRDDRVAWNKISPHFKKPELQRTQAIDFGPSLHKRYRTRRGNVTRFKTTLGYVTLGKEGKKARVFLKSKRRNVGWAKAGWNKAILGLGGAVNKGWISIHGFGNGALFDGRGNADPFVEVQNNTGWAVSGRGEANRIISNAIRSRSLDVQRYISRAMLRAAQNAAFIGPRLPPSE